MRTTTILYRVVAVLFVASCVMAGPLRAQGREEPAYSLKEVLTAEEYAKSGLQKLSAEELRFLNLRLFGRKAVEDAVEAPAVVPAVPAPASGGQVSEGQPAPVVAAPAAAPVVPAKPVILTVRHEVAPSGEEQQRSKAVSKLPKGEAAFGHEEKLKTAMVEIQKVPNELRSRILGPFEGWSGKTRFKLENGQVWQQAERGDFVVRLENPTIVIKKGLLGAFYLRVEGYNSQVRVKRVD